MTQDFNIQEYMTRGVERVVSDAVRATLKNPKESAYMARFALSSKAASAKRKKMEENGEHVPPFLIASITSSCNLHGAGCYSRCNSATQDSAPVDQLSDDNWKKVFNEADDLGVSFILLAGGEPLLRYGVIEAAGKKPSILFPIFTNGTFMGDKYLEMFDAADMGIIFDKYVTCDTSSIVFDAEDVITTSGGDIPLDPSD